MLQVKQVKDMVSGADTVSRKRNGNILLRKGFFYTHGMDGQKFANRIETDLQNNGITVQVVDYGMEWKSFKGRATVAQGSHFWVEIAVQ